MIDTKLLKYPEQLAARLTQMERDLAEAKREIKELKRKVADNG